MPKDAVMRKLLGATMKLERSSRTDRDLLRLFVDGRDQSAFEALVKRHANLVLGICCRSLPNRQDAEDACQAVFMILAKKANSDRWQASIANWLYSTARKVSRNARIVAKRRVKHEGQSAVPKSLSPLDQMTGRELLSALDDELERLPAIYREPLVLCHLEGLSRNQVATRLGVGPGTIKIRLERGRKKLADALTKRGIDIGAGLLAVAATSSAGASSPRLVESILATVGGSPSASVAAIAKGIAMNGFSSKAKLMGLVAGAVAATGFGLASIQVAAEPQKPAIERTKEPAPKGEAKNNDKPTDAQLLHGMWVFDSATRMDDSELGMVWTSKLTVSGENVNVGEFLGVNASLKGTIALDPAAEPKTFNLIVEELDLTKFFGSPRKIPRGIVRGIYKMDGDRLIVCFAAEIGGNRPESFDARSPKVFRSTLVKVPNDFKGFPKDFQVTAIGPDGKRVSGAVMTSHMIRRLPLVFRGPDDEPIDPSKLTEEQQKKQNEYKKPEGAIYDETSGWTFLDAKKTDADGAATVQYKDFRGRPVIVYDPKTKQMGIASVSPSSLLSGTVLVRLQPECHVFVTASTNEPTASPQEKAWFTGYIQNADGRAVASSTIRGGKLEYRLPPGEYTLEVIGGFDRGRKFTKLTVPKGRPEYVVPTVVVPSTGLEFLLGKPAPALSDVVAWKGPAVKLADLKGKLVLVHFWGYWCGQCIQEMPMMMDLHDKFKDKGLVIVGVHVDGEGEIDSVKALDEKLAMYRKDVWNGKDLPFSVALTSGMQATEDENAGHGRLAEKYGIRGYPKTVLIDREGKVVGTFRAGNAQAAAESIDYLLKVNKK